MTCPVPHADAAAAGATTSRPAPTTRPHHGPARHVGSPSLVTGAASGPASSSGIPRVALPTPAAGLRREEWPTAREPARRLTTSGARRITRPATSEVCVRPATVGGRKSSQQRHELVSAGGRRRPGREHDDARSRCRGTRLDRPAPAWPRPRAGGPEVGGIPPGGTPEPDRLGLQCAVPVLLVLRLRRPS